MEIFQRIDFSLIVPNPVRAYLYGFCKGIKVFGKEVLCSESNTSLFRFEQKKPDR